MSDFNFVLCFLLYIISYIIIHAFGLQEEGVVNGLIGRKAQFAYQVGILGYYDKASPFVLLGGGAIIGEKFILSAAHCFVNGSGYVQDLSYKVRLSSSNLRTMEGFLADVYKIFFAEYDQLTGANDLAVVELKYNLNLVAQHSLYKLELARGNESFANKKAVVAGYGYSSIKEASNSSGNFIRETDYKLYYVGALILLDEACTDVFQETIQIERQMCAVTKYTFYPNAKAGVCEFDGGGPLVVKKTVVGILSRHDPNCDDTTTGAIYTRVSYYEEYIHRIMQEVPDTHKIVHYNRPIPMGEIIN